MTTQAKLIRNTTAVAYSIKQCVYIFDLHTAEQKALPKITPALLHAVLSRMEEPTTKDGLISSLSAKESLDQSAAAEIVDLLTQEGLLKEEPGVSTESLLLGNIKQESFKGTVVLGITGAVSASMTPSAVFSLRQHLTENIEIILTDTATEFVSATSLQALSGKPVWRGIFDHPEITSSPHIHLASSADVIVIYPCSAHTLFKLAMASCDDLLSLTVCASEAPLILVPAMNNAMWRNASVQRNLSILREQGAIIIEPQLGLEVGTKLYGQIAHIGGPGVSDNSVVPTLVSILETLKSAK